MFRITKDLGRVQLMWVSGHRGISGNEMADLLTKKGSETKFIGSELYFGLSYRTDR